MTKSYAGLGLAMATALLLTACSKSPAVGHYKLDTEHFAEHFTELLIDNDKIPAFAEDQAKAMLKRAVFDLELKPDKSFVCDQRVGTERHTYEGTWSLVDTVFHLNQTHQDGQEKPDQGTGTLIGDKISVTLVDAKEGIEYTIKLDRILDNAASPR